MNSAEANGVISPALTSASTCTSTVGNVLKYEDLEVADLLMELGY